MKARLNRKTIMTYDDPIKQAPLQWWKIQTPISTSQRQHVLIYNHNREILFQLEDDLADELITGLGIKPVGDRVFVHALVKNGALMVNKDTITRKKRW
jgi:hypothetical protein